MTQLAGRIRKTGTGSDHLELPAHEAFQVDPIHRRDGLERERQRDRVFAIARKAYANFRNTAYSGSISLYCLEL
jgi:hypothetical protein